jgi:hypothetical protein
LLTRFLIAGAALVCNVTNVPLIGPYTGNYNLYQPFNRFMRTLPLTLPCSD